MSMIGMVVVVDSNGNEQIAYVEDIQTGIDYLSMTIEGDCMCQVDSSEACLQVPEYVTPDSEGKICYALELEGQTPGSTEAMAGQACIEVDEFGSFDVTFDVTLHYGLVETQLFVGSEISDVLDADGNIDTSKFSTGQKNLGGTRQSSLTSVLEYGVDVCAQAESYAMSYVGRVVVTDADGNLHTAYMLMVQVILMIHSCTSWLIACARASRLVSRRPKASFLNSVARSVTL
jgi:hypothetical protein